jgi:hypothetical protein
MDKPRDFYMDRDLLDKALESCDLGDGYMAKVRQYPHKDMRGLIRVREIRGYDHVLTGAQLERLLREVATGEKSDTDAMLEVLKNELQG